MDTKEAKTHSKAKHILPIVILAVGILLLLVMLAGMIFWGNITSSKEQPAVSFEEITAAENDNDPEKNMVIPVDDEIMVKATDTTAEDEPVEDEPVEDEPVEDYIFPNSATQALTANEVASLSKNQLSLARNEIIARHGRKFKSDDLQSYFDSKSWYHGTIDPDTFDATMDSVLSTVEKANIELIKSYE